MIIAKKLKEQNIAEYLIYMWQVEDLIRANGCDIDRLREQVIDRYPEDQRPALEEWYANLCDMMRAEGVVEKGHLQINRNVIQNLTELHGALLASTKYPFYNAAYFKARGASPTQWSQRRARAGDLLRSPLWRLAPAFAEEGDQRGDGQGDGGRECFRFDAGQLLRQGQKGRTQIGRLI